jgi:alkylated DNA repair dioxygenase AlkB
MIRYRGAREASLFSSPSSGPCETIVDGDGDIRLYRGWLADERADALLADIRERTVWVVERRKMYDRFVDVPREQAWFGEDRERPFTPLLERVRRDLESFTGAHFSHVLLNRYRNGNDSVAWHHDREGEGGRKPVIASLTLGVTRPFDVRSRADRARVLSIDLDHGDLILMAGDTQDHYEHRVRKDPRIAGERINLTFRQQAE